MENKYYTCQFCRKEFIPTRRKIQKFCSDTCRNKHFFHKKKLVTKKDLNEAVKTEEQQNLEKEKEPIAVEEMSASGVGNAAVGALLVEGVKGIAKAFQAEHNKPATKGDIEELRNLINTRYFEVHNIPSDMYGRKAYFDMGTGNIVYYDLHQKSYVLPI